VIGPATKLSRVTKPMCEHARDRLLELHKRPTARKLVSALRMILGDAKRRGLVAVNAAADTKVATAKRHKTKLKAGVDFPLPSELSTRISGVYSHKLLHAARSRVCRSTQRSLQMQDENENFPLAEDRLVGAKAIAKFRNEPVRRTNYLLDKRAIPAGKEGNTWVASKRALIAQHVKLTGGEAA
jgi:hypothetical protein